MKYYSIVGMDITDRGWVESYVSTVTKMIERHGGRYLTRTNRVEKFEGDGSLSQVYAIVEWPSREALQAFYDSEEYRPFREARMRGSKSELYVLPGEDVTKQARIEKRTS